MRTSRGIPSSPRAFPVARTYSAFLSPSRVGSPSSSSNVSRHSLVFRALWHTTLTNPPPPPSPQRSTSFARSFMTSPLYDVRGAVLLCFGPMACLIPSYMPLHCLCQRRSGSGAELEPVVTGTTPSCLLNLAPSSSECLQILHTG